MGRVNPISNMFRYLMAGVGEVGPVAREVLRETERTCWPGPLYISFSRWFMVRKLQAGVQAPVSLVRVHGYAIGVLFRKRLVLVSVIAVVLLALAILLAQWLRSIPAIQDYVVSYPGTTSLPEWAPVGIPAWVGWQHFFNAFLLVMLVRTGIILRSKTRPTIFWTRNNKHWPRTINRPRRIGFPLWLHYVLDALWVTNGVVYVVLLFATGQWVRIVPLNWTVIPNSLSVVLQYLSLDWPLENAWVAYNDAQLLAYFVVVFVAAPTAVLTGLRLSAVWPQRWNGLVPERTARLLHFPVMLFFVAFVFVHISLVFVTGMLRNLNFMYSGRDAHDWIGFVVFAVSLVIMVAGWLVSKSLLLVPIAKRFGEIRKIGSD